mmetsp:Transcript_67671/g.195591  ORF Transcript_67671/g.195591 Transcript_67671/m.195591 type:complete len:207 (-) Transcript_67671:144-764(-)
MGISHRSKIFMWPDTASIASNGGRRTKRCIVTDIPSKTLSKYSSILCSACALMTSVWFLIAAFQEVIASFFRKCARPERGMYIPAQESTTTRRIAKTTVVCKGMQHQRCCDALVAPDSVGSFTDMDGREPLFVVVAAMPSRWSWGLKATSEVSRCNWSILVRTQVAMLSWRPSCTDTGGGPLPTLSLPPSSAVSAPLSWVAKMPRS